MQREHSEHRITNARRAFIIKNIPCVTVRFAIICLSVGGEANGFFVRELCEFTRNGEFRRREVAVKPAMTGDGGLWGGETKTLGKIYLFEWKKFFGFHSPPFQSYSD